MLNKEIIKKYLEILNNKDISNHDEFLTSFNLIKTSWNDNEKIVKLFNQFAKIKNLNSNNDYQREQLNDLLEYKKRQIIKELEEII